MDKKEKAVANFRNPYSCSQTVYFAFGDGDGAKLEALKASSGGRAPDNMCGALFAALEILPEFKREAAKAEFVKRAGSSKCKELKTVNKTSCHSCVRIAAEILEENS